jgi:hypothetical protein
MTRALLVAALLPILVARASADPDPAPQSGVRFYGLVDYTAFVTGIPGIGIGVELASGRDSISLDASGGALPVCFIACAIFDWGGVSIAYHHQITNHIFVGPRVAAVYRAAQVPDSTDDDETFGWTGLGLVEAGFRRAANGWIASASLGAGVSVAADHTLGPAISVRVTIGR